MPTLDKFSRIVFADASGVALESGDDFDFGFRVDKSRTRDPDTAEIIGNNLAKSTRMLSTEAVTLEIYAGKSSPPPLIFKGEVTDVVNTRTDDFVDWLTQIYAEDTKDRMRTRVVARTYAAGTEVAFVISDLSAAATIPVDLPVITTKLPSAMSFLGPPKDGLFSVCSRFGYRYQVIDGRLVVREEDAPVDETSVPIISGETGLIGAPTAELDGRVVKVSFRCELNAQLIPGGLCVIETKAAGPGKRAAVKSGAPYYIERVTHTKSANGDDFTTACECKEYSI